MSFDRLAPHYRWMERVLAGGLLQRCRTAFLDEVTPPQRVLIPGEGHGRFLCALLARHPAARVTVIESSARMIATARRAALDRGLSLEHVDFHETDLLAWRADAPVFDLVAANFVFDCFPAADLAALIGQLAAASTASAQWLVADFRIPETGPARWRARLILWGLYRFFRIATRLPAAQLTPPDPLLRAHGFARKDRRVFDWGLLHSDLWIRQSHETLRVNPPR